MILRSQIFQYQFGFECAPSGATWYFPLNVLESDAIYRRASRYVPQTTPSSGCFSFQSWFFRAVCTCAAKRSSHRKGISIRAGGAEDGLGAVFDIQQSQDGYLWLTTSRDVLRFDGVKFETVEEVSNGAIRNDEAYTAMAGRSDYVWSTTRAAGLLLWKDRKVTAFPFDRRCVTASLTNGTVEDLNGSLWGRALAGLYDLNGSSCEYIGRTRLSRRLAGRYLRRHERYRLGKGALWGIGFAVTR